MSNKTTLVVTAMPNADEQEAMQTYLAGVMPLLMGAGGQLVKRVIVKSSLTGKPSFGMALMMDFPDREAIESVFASDTYAALIPDRDKGFASIDICLADEM